MAFGKSLEGRWTKRTKALEDRPLVASRDRSLRGKARIKARKAANKVRSAR